MKSNCFKVFVLITLCCSTVLGVSQVAYYDAIKIKNSLDGNEMPSTMAGVLLNYFILPKSINNKADTLKALNDSLKANPFLEEFTIDLSGVESSLGARTGNLLNKIGGLDVTNLANGISQFMIKRAKEELTIAFFERFKQFAEENPEFEVLFPKTTRNLENLLTYKYPEFLPVLRTGFFEDIEATPYHLDDVLQLPRYQSLLRTLPEVKVAVRTVRLIYELESGYSHAADILPEFADFPEWSDRTSSISVNNFGSSVKLASIFSQSLRNDTAQSNSSRAWVTYPEVRALVSNDTSLRIYLGLVYQLVKHDSIIFYAHNSKQHIVAFTNIMARYKNDLFVFHNKISEFIELVDQLEEVTAHIHLLNEGHVTAGDDTYYGYMDLSFDVLDYALSFGSLFDEKLNFEQYVLLAHEADDLYRHIYKQEYSSAITDLIDILEQIKAMVDANKPEWTQSTIVLLDSLGIKNDFEKKKEWKDKHMASIEKYINSPQSNPLQVKELQKIKSNYYWDQLGGKLLKISEYGLFMANMANAKTPQEVASILDNATLPVGSSSIKKNSKCNVAIQSYLGPYVLMDKPDNTNAWTSQFGVTAPIGIAFSKGFTHKGGSLSLFVSLLDLGAIVDYQLKAETITTPDGFDTTTIHKDYKVELGQIFSPGTYLVYGLPWRLPLSFGIGGQYGPGLGKIEDDNDVVINNPAWRWNAFLAVDIPLFNLANTPRRK